MVLTMLGPFIFQAVLSKRHAKGYHQMIHRTDEGFLFTQQGGEELDRVSLSFTFTGAERDLWKATLNAIIVRPVPLWLFTSLVSFRYVRVISLDFSESAGKSETISGLITIQRLRIAKWDRKLGIFTATARLIGTVVSIAADAVAGIDSTEALWLPLQTWGIAAIPVLSQRSLTIFRG